MHGHFALGETVSCNHALRCEAGFYPIYIQLRKQAQRGHCLVSRHVRQLVAWHSDRDKFMYPINAFILGAYYVPKTILGAGDTKMKDTGAL